MNNPLKSNIFVALSGGVDSAVAAYLLKQQGYTISGIFMQNWEVENDDPYCQAEQDLTDAQVICQHLNIPLHVVNFAKQYWDNVFQHCLDEYAAGRTPNPDIGCNKEIKFKALLHYALELGANCLATGHYVKSQQLEQRYQLQKAFDQNKDQSYFLYTLGQFQLAHSLFPLGELEKPQVRKIAAEAGLSNFNKKDSTGICFIGERKFKQFLSEFLLTKPGPMITTDGQMIGKHDGLMFYTIGQRKGLNIGGRKEAKQEPWYVIAKDVPKNTLVIGQGHDHPLLYTDTLTCEKIHWISEFTPSFPLYCTAKTRYRQVDQPCTVTQLVNDTYQVKFAKPQRAITAGQSVVFYDRHICLGGGIISKTPSP